MNCPKCGSKTKVLKVSNKDKFTWRQRQCTKCGYIFSTKEMPSSGWNWKNLFFDFRNDLEKVFQKYNIK